ncbi:MAG TPA: ChaN family lipoprotein, partial [Burkholderiales bacterium]|nr:ChaN family lipoprotein [Burkholderiales bacterium]
MKPLLPALLYLAALLMTRPVEAQTRPDGPSTVPRCVPPSAWYTLEPDAPRLAKAGELLGAMAKRDVILLGEHHDDEAHHEWQLQTLAALHLLRPQMVIGFESFPRRIQPVLDRWVAGELTVKQFLEQSDWKNVWNLPAELYLPLFQFARIN